MCIGPGLRVLRLSGLCSGCPMQLPKWLSLMGCGGAWRELQDSGFLLGGTRTSLQTSLSRWSPGFGPDAFLPVLVPLSPAVWVLPAGARAEPRVMLQNGGMVGPYSLRLCLSPQKGSSNLQPAVRYLPGWWQVRVPGVCQGDHKPLGELGHMMGKHFCWELCPG